MKLKVYSIYDAKIEAYMNPFFLRNKGEAIRAFSDLVNDPQTNVHRHAADYTLFEVSEWDDNKAQFSDYLTPINLGVALEFRKENSAIAA